MERRERVIINWNFGNVPEVLNVHVNEGKKNLLF